MHVASLYLYPLKSCAPLAVQALEIEPRGPSGDRRWLIVDAQARFVTAREHPAVAGIRALPALHGITLDAPGMPTLHVAAPAAEAARLHVAIWKDTVNAPLCAPEAAAWLTRYLGFAVQLVHMDAAACRAVNPRHAAPGDEVSFADAYPLLVLSQSALDALNARLPGPIPITRFRPNIVVADAAPHAEDDWRRVRIGDVEFEATTRCTRCVFTTLDTDTLERDPDGEPLRTLARYRRGEGGVVFGMNLVPRGTGRIAVGDAIRQLA